jgi:DNA-binding transcriptional LysR family regulator
LAHEGHNIEDFSRTIILDDLRLTLETVVSGGGIAFISRSMAAKQIAAGLLHEHRVHGFVHVRQRTAVFSSEKMNDPAIKEFICCIVDSFPNEAAAEKD